LSSVYSRRNHHERGYFESNINVTVSGTTSIIIVVQPTLVPATETEAELYLISGSAKKDVNYGNSAWIAWDPVSGVGPTYPVVLPANGTELYTSAAGNNVSIVGIDNFGRMEALIWSASSFGAPFQTLLWNTLFSSSCATFGDIQPVKIVYDFESSKFVVGVLAGNIHNTFCVAVSQTSDPTGSWWSYVFTDASFFNYTNGFDFAVWGDYYTACWNADAIQKCAIFERSQMVIGGTPNVVLVTNLFTVTPGFGTPPIEPFPQRESKRGVFMNITAPCGAFAMLDEGSSTLHVSTCSSINFTTQSAIFATYVIPISGGWFSGANLSCTYCIPTCYGVNVLAFSNYLRLAYFNYDTYESIGFAFANNVGTAANVKWAVVNMSDILATNAIAPSTYSSVVATNLFATGVILTCRGTFIMSSSDGCNSVVTTYRLRTDPIGTVRGTPFVLGGFLPGFGRSSMGMTNVNTGQNLPRSFFVVSPNINGYTSFSGRLQNNTATIFYTATDACGASSTCTQTAFLNTIAPCNNSYIPW